MNKIPIGVATFLLLVGGDLLGQGGQGQRRGRRGMDVARVLERFDANKDGKLAADEVTNERMWRRLVSADKDQDGFVTKKEMESLSGGAGRRGGRGGGSGGEAAWRFLRDKYDANKDGAVSSDEYDRDPATFQRLDRNGDGSLTAADWSEDGGGRTRGDSGRRGQGRGGRAAVPEAGDKAPDFELTFVNDAKKKVRLSKFAGDKPVALIFGSCT